jgi:hypothetical protein
MKGAMRHSAHPLPLRSTPSQKKAVAVRGHLEQNRKDMDAKFRLILIEVSHLQARGSMAGQNGVQQSGAGLSLRKGELDEAEERRPRREDWIASARRSGRARGRQQKAVRLGSGAASEKELGARQVCLKTKHCAAGGGGSCLSKCCCPARLAAGSSSALPSLRTFGQPA